MLGEKTKVEAQSKKVIRRNTINPDNIEKESSILRLHILDNPYNPPASPSKEELWNLKAHQIEVEKRRSMALYYFRRNTIR